MHDYFNDLKPAGFSFLTENQLKEVESKGTLAKPFIMKRAKINMYNFIDSFFFDLFDKRAELFYNIVHSNNGDIKVINDKFNKCLSDTFLRSYDVFIESKKLTEKQIPRKAVVNIINDVLSHPRKPNYKKNVWKFKIKKIE